MNRFFQSVIEFNVIKPIGSIYENSFAKKKKNQLGSSTSKLVNFVCYCLNSNHYHFLIKQIAENGIEKFMHRLGTGYTKYFNNKTKRSGALFQGRFKSIHVGSNEYLLHLSAYINLNDKVHQLGSSTSKFKSVSSWGEYATNGGSRKNFCVTNIISNQFNNSREYQNFATSSLKEILRRRDEEEISKIILE